LMSTSTMGSGVVGSSITGPDFELQTVAADSYQLVVELDGDNLGYQ
ncbi:hypothetical protein Tco_1271149, partial [Tanacetum coccineum]